MGEQIFLRTVPLDADGRRLLLAINPNFRGSALRPPSPRFIPLEPLRMQGGTLEQTWTGTIREESMNGRETIHTRLVEEESGLLRDVFQLPVGPEEDRTVIMTTTHRAIQTDVVERTVSTFLRIELERDEDYAVDIFYDTVFGTFYFKRERRLLPTGGSVLPGGVVTGGGVG